MSADRLSDDDHREPARAERREDMLHLVRQRLAQSPRIVRLSRRTRRAVGAKTPSLVGE